MADTQETSPAPAAAAAPTATEPPAETELQPAAHWTDLPEVGLFKWWSDHGEASLTTGV
jgi:hypothetical protein